jgi:thioredoxin 1
VAIKFFATWCGPCNLYKSVFERASSRYPDMDFYEVDVDESPDIREWFGVSSIPTTLILEDGEKLVQQPGALSTKGLDDVFGHVLSYKDAHST